MQAITLSAKSGLDLDVQCALLLCGFKRRHQPVNHACGVNRQVGYWALKLNFSAVVVFRNDGERIAVNFVVGQMPKLVCYFLRIKQELL